MHDIGKGSKHVHCDHVENFVANNINLLFSNIRISLVHLLECRTNCKVFGIHINYWKFVIILKSLVWFAYIYLLLIFSCFQTCISSAIIALIRTKLQPVCVECFYGEILNFSFRLFSLLLVAVPFIGITENWQCKIEYWANHVTINDILKPQTFRDFVFRLKLNNISSLVLCLFIFIPLILSVSTIWFMYWFCSQYVWSMCMCGLIILLLQFEWKF